MKHDTERETARRMRQNVDVDEAEFRRAIDEAELRRAIDTPVRPVQMARPVPTAKSTRALSAAIAVAQGMLLGVAIIGLAALIWWILGGRA